MRIYGENIWYHLYKTLAFLMDQWRQQVLDVACMEHGTSCGPQPHRCFGIWIKVHGIGQSEAKRAWCRCLRHDTDTGVLPSIPPFLTLTWIPFFPLVQLTTLTPLLPSGDTSYIVAECP